MTPEFLERQLGKYTLAGTKLTLAYSTGLTEEGTLAEGHLSLMHIKPNWLGYPRTEWNFVRRK